MAAYGDNPKNYSKDGKVKASKNPFAALPKNRKGVYAQGWDEVAAEVLQGLIVAASNAGAAVMFGITSDQGALTLTYYWKGEKESTYIGPSDDIEEILRLGMEFFTQNQ
jgi:hypothetical protein